MRLRNVRFLAFALFAPLLGVACGSDDDDGKSSTTQQACTPGQSVSCTGPGACSGFQVCNQKGTGYGSCTCGSNTGGSTGTGGTTAKGGSTSSGGSGGGSGGSSGGPTSSTCTPSDMSGFTPKYVKARPKQNVCTPEEVADYFTRDCHQGLCLEYEEGGAKATCGKCLAPSPLSDANYGPLVTLQVGEVTSWETNSAGCVEIVEGKTTCAEKLQAAQECAREACVNSCQPTNSTEYQQYSACQASARTGVCKTFQDQTRCLSAAASNSCNGTDLFIVLGKNFCANP